jgi:hypothetical protein
MVKSRIPGDDNCRISIDSGIWKVQIILPVKTRNPDLAG